MQSTTKMALAMLGAGAVWNYLRRRNRRDVRGKTALITGSSRGLGFLMAREYVRRGCRVVICARDESELEVARHRLRRGGAEVLAIGCDVSDEEQVRHMVDRATRHFGSVDILVTNAGIIPIGPVEEQTIEDFEEALGTMFYGVLFPIWNVLPQMVERGGGRIVNITSIGGRLSFPHLLPYTCAKYAAVGLSRGLHAELRRHGISVTTVVPGLMRTGSYAHALFKGQREREFTWFTLSSSLPLITVDARRAARRIVDASIKKKTEYVVGAPAKLGTVVAGLFPGITAELLAKVDEVILPRAQGRSQSAVPGKFVQPTMGGALGRIVDIGATLGRQAGERYNQYLGERSTRG